MPTPRSMIRPFVRARLSTQPLTMIVMALFMIPAFALTCVLALVPQTPPYAAIFPAGIAALLAFQWGPVWRPDWWPALARPADPHSPAGIATHLTTHLRALQADIHRTTPTPPFSATAIFSLQGPEDTQMATAAMALEATHNTAIDPALRARITHAISQFPWSSDLSTAYHPARRTAQILALRTTGKTLTITVPALTAHELLALHKTG